MQVGDTVYMSSFFMLNPIPCVILEICEDMVNVKTDKEEGWANKEDVYLNPEDCPQR